MSENTPEASAPEASAPEDVAAKDATGVGVYDTTLERFVGGKFASKGDADAFVKDAGVEGHDYVTRKV